MACQQCLWISEAVWQLLAVPEEYWSLRSILSTFQHLEALVCHHYQGCVSNSSNSFKWKKTLQSRTTQKMKPSTSKRKKRLEIKKSRLKIVIEEKRNTFFVPKESSSVKVDIQLTVDGRLVSELGAKIKCKPIETLPTTIKAYPRSKYCSQLGSIKCKPLFDGSTHPGWRCHILIDKTYHELWKNASGTSNANYNWRRLIMLPNLPNVIFKTLCNHRPNFWGQAKLF